MRLIDSDELMQCYENTPKCNIDDCHVPIPIIRQNIIDMPTVNPYEWISVEDRLPKESTQVLVYIPNMDMNVDDVVLYYARNNEWWDHNGWATTKYFGITHWMPLPTPPTEKENNNESF